MKALCNCFVTCNHLLMLPFVSLFFTLLPNVVDGQQFEVQFNSVADGYMWSAGGRDGTSDDLRCGYEPSPGWVEMVVRFDISGIPSTATINEATVYLYHFDAYGTYDSRWVHAYPYKRSWTEQNITWQTFDNKYDDWQSKNWIAGGGSKFYPWIVTDAVRKWHTAQHPNYGIMFSTDSNSVSNQLRFHSRESSAAAARPFLSVKYTVPDTTPPTPSKMYFSTNPYATGTTSLSMTATTASDTSGVQYRFLADGAGATGRGYESGRSYTNPGLSVNTAYGYACQARDLSPNQNQNTTSDYKYAYTLQNTPSIVRIGRTDTSISLRADSVANISFDSSGVRWKTDSGNGADGRDWNKSNTHIDDGLQPGREYRWSVEARNGDGIGTGYISWFYAYTNARVPNAPTVTKTGSRSINVTINGNGNASVVQYAIHCVTTNQYVSASGTLGSSVVWRTQADWGTRSVTGLTPSKNYSFRVGARNEDNEETGFSQEASATTDAEALSLNPTGCSIAPSTRGPGETFEATYSINNPNAVAVTVGLGMGIVPVGMDEGWIWDEARDRNVSIPAQSTQVIHKRDFKVPESASAGNYRLWYAIQRVDNHGNGVWPHWVWPPHDEKKSGLNEYELIVAHVRVEATLQNVTWSDYEPQNVSWNIGGKLGSGNPADISGIPTGSQLVIARQRPSTGTWQTEDERWIHRNENFVAGYELRDFRRDLPHQTSLTPYEGTMLLGDSRTPSVRVGNDSGENRSVRVEVFVSRSKNRSSPDWSDNKTFTVNSNSESGEQPFKAFTPSVIGTYYRCYQVQTSIGGSWVTTDTGDWHEMIEVQPLPTATVTATLLNIEGSDWMPGNVVWDIGGKSASGNGVVIADIPGGVQRVLASQSPSEGPWAETVERWVDREEDFPAGSYPREFRRDLPCAPNGISWGGDPAEAKVGDSMVPQVQVSNNTSSNKTVTVEVSLSRQNSFATLDYAQQAQASIPPGGRQVDLPAFTPEFSGNYYGAYWVKTSGLTGGEKITDTGYSGDVPTLWVGLAPPQNVRPLEQSVALGAQYSIHWDAVDGADRYVVQRSKFEDFNSPEILANVQTTSLTTTADQPGTHYHRVMADNSETGKSSDYSQTVTAHIGVFFLDRSVSKTSVRDGESFTVSYRIRSDQQRDAMLGCSLRRSGTEAWNIIEDRDNDKDIPLLAGDHWYTRTFVLNLPPGSPAETHTCDALWGVHLASGDKVFDGEDNAISVVPVHAVSLPILMYHKVGPTAYSRYWVTTDAFQEQMKALKAYGYTTVTLQDVMDYRAGLKTPPAKPVLITFDDGYKNLLDEAYPVLADPAIDFKATAFIITGKVDGNNSWDAGDNNPVIDHLSWSDIQNLHNSGRIDIQSHTVNHPRLTDAEAALADELTGSRVTLKEQLGKTVRFLCYPYGDYDADVQAAARKAGYHAAVTAGGGLETDCADKWALRRIEIDQYTSVNYSQDHADKFFMTQVDPNFPVPRIRIDSVQYLDPASGQPLTTVSRGQQVRVRVTATNEGSASPVVVSLNLDDDANPSNGMMYDSHQTSPSEDQTFTFSSDQQVLIDWIVQVPGDTEAGPVYAMVGFHDAHYVLGYAYTDWLPAFGVVDPDNPVTEYSKWATLKQNDGQTFGLYAKMPNGAHSFMHAEPESCALSFYLTRDPRDILSVIPKEEYLQNRMDRVLLPLLNRMGYLGYTPLGEHITGSTGSFYVPSTRWPRLWHMTWKNAHSMRKESYKEAILAIIQMEGLPADIEYDLVEKDGSSFWIRSINPQLYTLLRHAVDAAHLITSIPISLDSETWNLTDVLNYICQAYRMDPERFEAEVFTWMMQDDRVALFGRLVDAMIWCEGISDFSKKMVADIMLRVYLSESILAQQKIDLLRRMYDHVKSSYMIDIDPELLHAIDEVATQIEGEIGSLAFILTEAFSDALLSGDTLVFVLDRLVGSDLLFGLWNRVAFEIGSFLHVNASFLMISEASKNTATAVLDSAVLIAKEWKEMADIRHRLSSFMTIYNMTFLYHKDYGHHDPGFPDEVVVENYIDLYHCHPTSP